MPHGRSAPWHARQEGRGAPKAKAAKEVAAPPRPPKVAKPKTKVLAKAAAKARASP